MDREQKPTDAVLRRNILRSLLILKSTTLQELPGSVTGLTYLKARCLMRELETHGYACKSKRPGIRRPEYSLAKESAYLPELCGHCGRAYATKVCAKKAPKRNKEKERKKEKERETIKVADAAIVQRGREWESEVNHDAA